MPSSRSSSAASFDVEALLAGDHRAFASMVRQESPRLFRVIRRLVRDDDAARSVMQETFLQAYQRLDTFRGEAKFTTWLYGIGINLARGWLRKNRRHNSLDELDMDRLQPTFHRGMYETKYTPWRPDQLAEQSQRIDLVHRAIERLPESYRIVITLRDLEELSTAEAAQILQISETNVRVRLHRARQALRSLLDDHFGRD